MAGPFFGGAFFGGGFFGALPGGGRRTFVELRGKILEVADYAEAEQLLKELRSEEKAQEKDQKRLKIVAKKWTVDLRSKAVEKQIETIEQRMDDRLEKMARLYAEIAGRLDEIEDEEEFLLLSH